MLIESFVQSIFAELLKTHNNISTVLFAPPAAVAQKEQTLYPHSKSQLSSKYSMLNNLKMALIYLNYLTFYEGVPNAFTSHIPEPVECVHSSAAQGSAAQRSVPKGFVQVNKDQQV